MADKMADVKNLAAENGQRGAQRAIRIAGGAPIRSSWMCTVLFMGQIGREHDDVL